MITGLDHVGILVRDSKAVGQQLAAVLGREVNWQGKADGFVHSWIQLDNMALDIFEPAGDGDFARMARERLETRGEGIFAMAFRVADAEADGKLFARRGLGELRFDTVQVTASEDDAVRQWTLAGLPPERCGGLETLLVADSDQNRLWPGSTTLGDAIACASGLDHVVVVTPSPERAVAFYGGRLGLDLRLERIAPQWGTHFLFFRTGGTTVEVVHPLKDGVSNGPDSFMGFTWLVPDIEATHGRLAAQGLNLSEIRTGRRKGSRVFTLRDAPAAIPTLFLSQDPAEAET